MKKKIRCVVTKAQHFGSFVSEIGFIWQKIPQVGNKKVLLCNKQCQTAGGSKGTATSQPSGFPSDEHVITQSRSH